MKNDERRLMRLARAQHELVKQIEAQISAANRHVADLAITRLSTMAAVDRAGVSGLVFYAAAMRRLSELETARAAMDQKLQSLSGNLIKARAKEDILLQRTGRVAAANERREFETRALEVSLPHKATSKPRMMK